MPKINDTKAPFRFRVVKIMLDILEMKPARISRALNISTSHYLPSTTTVSLNPMMSIQSGRVLETTKVRKPQVYSIASGLLKVYEQPNPLQCPRR